MAENTLSPVPIHLGCCPPATHTSFKWWQYDSNRAFLSQSLLFIMWCINHKLIYSCCRFETRGHYMSHAKTSAHHRITRNIQLRGNALHGIWIVSAGSDTVTADPRNWLVPYNSIVIDSPLFNPMGSFVAADIMLSPYISLDFYRNAQLFVNQTG